MALAALLAGIAQQPQPPGPPTAPAPAGGDREVVVTGERIRGSAIGTVPPIATLDPDALRALGVSTVKDMLQQLKGLTASGGGGEPVPLLNGRRISGWQELYDIPFEAIERTEILPEEGASRFGFPPTVRVMNFITQKHFRAASTLQLAGTTTEGGGGTDYTELAATQIEGDRRTAVKMSYFRQDRVWQGSRAIAPDPVTRFALPGNVAAADGASIDPRLDALAGQAVTIAAVPDDPARRGTLAAYVAGANRPATTDTGRWRTLVPTRDTLQASGTIALPLGREVSGSLNLAMEAQRSAGANGWAGATLTVPGGGGAGDAAPRRARDRPARWRHAGRHRRRAAAPGADRQCRGVDRRAERLDLCGDPGAAARARPAARVRPALFGADLAGVRRARGSWRGRGRGS